jgi:hypothetical protein
MTDKLLIHLKTSHRNESMLSFLRKKFGDDTVEKAHELGYGTYILTDLN